MQGQEYLNQISATNRPNKKPFNNILSSKFFIVGAVGVILLLLIIIIGAIMKGGKGDEKELSYALIAHLNGTAEDVQEFQEKIKSSDLRSDAGSLYGVLTNTSSELTSYLEAKYDFDEKDIDDDISEEAELAKTNLYDELFEAKINGILDRIFAHKMAYEISLFKAEEEAIMKVSKNEELEALLQNSCDSLDNLYPKFNEFSEGDSRTGNDT